MPKKYILLAILFVVFLSHPHDIFASHRRQVLGVSTKASDVSFPQIAAGPGWLLPDNRLYFLDAFVQGLRLAMTQTPEKKAMLHLIIAQERLAETSLMLAKDDETLANVAMASMTREVAFATQNLKRAANQGKNVTTLARQMNNTIKEQRAVLRTVSEQVSGPLRLQIEATREKLKEDKYRVEDQLPEDELKKEIQDAISEELVYKISDTTNVLYELDYHLAILSEEASASARQALAKRQKALEMAIAEKNYAVQSAEAKLLQEDRKRQEKMYAIREETLRQARISVAEARRAAEKYQIVHEADEELQSAVMGAESHK